MAKEFLSDLVCKNATSEGKSIKKLSDGGGLYLWVYADGKKYWRLRYWLAGKEKSLSLGVYPEIGLAKARKAAIAQQEKLENNLDPSAERRADKLKIKQANENSFQAVAEEWFAKQLHIWVKSHATDVERRLKMNIYPLLGKRPINQIEAPELLATIQVIERRGSYDLAHRVLQVCGQVFRYGIATGRCNRNLAADLRGALTPHKQKHQNAVNPEELPDLLKAIQKYEEQGDEQTVLALFLLAHTFVRTNELINAEKTEFNFDKSMWNIPPERMKMKSEHLVPLTNQSTKIILRLFELSGSSRYLLAGRNPDKPISNNTLLYALYRMGFKGKMTGHGFRSVASTILNESSFNSDVIERQLAHSERNEIRAAYNRAIYIKDRVKMMEWWSNYLDQLTKPKAISHD